MLHHDFRRFLDALDELNPAQIEGARTKIRDHLCLSRWQLPILAVADRGGARLFQRLTNRKGATLELAMKPLVPGDAVLCSDGANGYSKLATASGIENFVIGSKPGTELPPETRTLT